MRAAVARRDALQVEEREDICAQSVDDGHQAGAETEPELDLGFKEDLDDEIALGSRRLAVPCLLIGGDLISFAPAVVSVEGMNTYTDVVSAIAIRVADPLVSLRWLPEVLLLEEAEGEIDQSQDLEKWSDHIGVDVDRDPGGWYIGLGEDADVQQPLGRAGKLNVHVSFDFS